MVLRPLVIIYLLKYGSVCGKSGLQVLETFLAVRHLLSSLNSCYFLLLSANVKIKLVFTGNHTCQFEAAAAIDTRGIQFGLF